MREVTHHRVVLYLCKNSYVRKVSATRVTTGHKRLTDVVELLPVAVPGPVIGRFREKLFVLFAGIVNGVEEVLHIIFHECEKEEKDGFNHQFRTTGLQA